MNSNRLPPLKLAAELERILELHARSDLTVDDWLTVDSAAATIRDLHELCNLLDEGYLYSDDPAWQQDEDRIRELKLMCRFGG